MKLLHFITGLAVVALAACSSNDLVDPTAVDNRDTQPIGFAVKSANSSRASLESVHEDFGVWGYKGNDLGNFKSNTATQTIMENYLVGWTGNSKYTAPSDPFRNNYGSKWFYEGFGSTDLTNGISQNANQYLKYWDLAFTNSYFFAYAPYIHKKSSDGTTSYYVTFNPSTLKMEFPRKFWCNTESSSDWMYGAVEVVNVTYQKQTVPIEFKRLTSMVQIAIYEVIPGYKVEMQDFKFSGQTNTTYGVAMIPTKRTAKTDPDEG